MMFRIVDNAAADLCAHSRLLVMWMVQHEIPWIVAHQVVGAVYQMVVAFTEMRKKATVSKLITPALLPDRHRSHALKTTYPATARG